MKFSLTFTAILMAVNLSFAGQNSQYQIVKQRLSLESSKIPTYIEYSDEKRPALAELKSLFQNYWKGVEGFDFVEIGQEIDQLGFTHYRYEQTFNGVPIELAVWIVHVKNDEIHSMNGKLVDQIPASIQNSISTKAAFSAAKRYVGAKKYKWEIPAEEKHLKFETGNPFATYYPAPEMKYIGKSMDLNSGDLHLTYKFNVYAQEPLSRQEIYVDASSGDVIFVNNLIHTANTTGTAQTAYSGTQTIKVDSLASNSFRLRQTINGNGVNTYNLLRGTSYANSVDFTDADNNWNNVNALRDQYATDAHWGAENTHEYFQVKFGRNSINNNGFTLNSYLHYSVNYNNAFWDGQRMTYGDGSGSFTPLVSLDIASHEITHGLTTFTANLIYANESGALNESFSDIFGAAVEFFARPNRANWLLGEDIGGAFRSLSNPRQYGDPDTYDGTNWRQTIGCIPTQNNDQCGVHSNSGVQNKWFYLLTVGGSGTNTAPTPQTYSVTGLGIDTAAAIAFRNLTVYLTRSSNFADARFYAIQSAIDLYGACSPQHISVVNAWHAVGVGAAYSPGVTSDFTANITQGCSTPLNISFTNNSNNATSFVWDFGDGSFSTVREPSHNYITSGQFDVSLISDGGACGIDTITKSNFITITRPLGPTVSDDSICLGQTASLTASASGVVDWYSNEFGGNPIATGNTYSLPNVTSNTQLWAENLNAAPIQTVGPTDNTIGGGANFTGFQYLIFDVLDKIELISVRVYAANSGNRTIELRDANGTVLQSLSRYVPAGAFRVNLNFQIDPGTDYQLGIPVGTQPNLYRNNSGTSYPYTIANKVSIKRSSAGTNPTGFYYFFYNWRVKSPDCSSARVPVNAIVDTTCNITGVTELDAEDNNVQIYPNPTQNTFTVEASDQGIEQIRVLDLSGKIIHSEQNNNIQSKLLVNSVNWESGVYFIQIYTGSGIFHQKVVVTH